MATEISISWFNEPRVSGEKQKWIFSQCVCVSFSASTLARTAERFFGEELQVALIILIGSKLSFCTCVVPRFWKRWMVNGLHHLTPKWWLVNISQFLTSISLLRSDKYPPLKMVLFCFFNSYSMCTSLCTQLIGECLGSVWSSQISYPILLWFAVMALWLSDLFFLHE